MSGREGELIAGRYRIVSPIGNGGMGQVWLAEDTLLRRRVALKEIEFRGTNDLDVIAARRARAYREARAAASVKHPGVVEIFDVILKDKDPWIVMARVEGVSLDELIPKGTLQERDIARIGLCAAAALDALHRKGVRHRDVKPANIVIGESFDDVVLVDFGVAAMDGHTSLTQGGQVLGTPEYLAPERIDGNRGDAPADLWSLGVTLYAALEGRTPFHRASREATVAAILARDPAPFTRPGPLATVITELLRKEPQMRPDAAVLRVRLEAIVAGRRPQTFLPPGDVRPGMWAPPHREIHDPSVHRSGQEAVRTDPAELVDRLKAMDHTSARAYLGRKNPRDAADALLALLPGRAAAILVLPPASGAGALVDLMADRPADAANVLRAASPVRAGRILDHVESAAAAAILGMLPPGEAAVMLATTGARTAAGVIEATPVAMSLLASMTIERATAVLTHVQPRMTARLLGASADGRAEQILARLDRRLRERVEQYMRHPDGARE